MNNKTKIITVVIVVITVGLGVTLRQPKTSDIQEPIVPVVVDEIEEVEPLPEEIGGFSTIDVTPVVEVIEPAPVAVEEPEPNPLIEQVVKVAIEPVEVAQVAKTYTGQTYATVYNGVTYTVTQEQLYSATGGRGSFSDVDGIPSAVFFQISNAGATAGSMGMTDEEFKAQRNDSSLLSDTAYKLQ